MIYRIFKRGIILKCWTFSSYSLPKFDAPSVSPCFWYYHIAAEFWKCQTSQMKYFSGKSSFCCSNLEHCRRFSPHLTHLFVHVWSCSQWFPVDKKITACWPYFTIVNFITSSSDKYYSLDSEDDFCSGCWNVSHQQQFFSELPSPRRSQNTSYFTIFNRRVLGISIFLE